MKQKKAATPTPALLDCFQNFHFLHKTTKPKIFICILGKVMIFL
tara:strand:- start:234 stop:365 length:132 start_codon:yes stop_codon:yes gene_type:complete